MLLWPITHDFAHYAYWIKYSQKCTSPETVRLRHSFCMYILLCLQLGYYVGHKLTMICIHTVAKLQNTPNCEGQKKKDKKSLLLAIIYTATSKKSEGYGFALYLRRVKIKNCIRYE